MTISDPLGHQILKERISKCPTIIQGMLDNPIQTKLPNLSPSQHFIVTGIGSSNAHGKFLTDLINRYTPSSATFLDLIHFYSNLNSKLTKPSILVLFSQGLSPNALLAINQRHHFKHLILFTSSTHTDLIKTLKSEGHTIIQFPLENEYTLLLRIIGPLTGYLAAIQWVNNNFPSPIPPCDNHNLISAIKNANTKVTNTILETLENLKQNAQSPILLMPSPLCEYGYNLAYKFLEGLFIPMPIIVDYLSFAHGFFQELISNPRPIIIFKENTPESQLLYNHAKPMIEIIRSQTIEITSNLPPPWNIFEYEAILNHLILKGIEKFSINQIAWPGKNLDSSLYNIKEPCS